jgi:prephenate dehydrogenase
LKVAVLGSSGGMGKFLTRYFLSHGNQVTGSDKRRDGTEDPHFTVAGTNGEAVRGADIVVIATPIDATVDTVAEITGKLARGTTLVEIASVKGKILPEIRKLLRGKGVKLLSLHPLFGPSLSSFEGMKICVIETEKTSISAARRLFPEAALIPMSEEAHDRTMGVILSLTHLLNIAYAATVSEYLKPEEFRAVQTPTSSLQLTLAEGVLAQSASLYSYNQMENAWSSEYAAALIDELTQLLKLIEDKDRSGFERHFRELSAKYAGDSKGALEQVYRTFEKNRL